MATIPENEREEVVPEPFRLPTVLTELAYSASLPRGQNRETRIVRIQDAQ
ncbi:MAG: hypothetical protein KatS3mg111_2825 [Pirellulaceae bacterium]|nr:MAG: hypothetical protein KatS3mg111_2825 [Pirellulaceae bacterium]